MTDNNSSCQPEETDIFGSHNRRRCESYVRIIQGRLDKAVADNHKEKIRWYVHLLTKRSRAAKILAIYHVTAQNHGRHTPGVDGLGMVKGSRKENQKIRRTLLEMINIKKKPSPIRRVMIPKPNGKLRPLGIPTIGDRVIQDIIRMALEPITEYHASENSYGFRPGRSCHGAMEHLFVKLSKRNSKQWLIEGDIKGCFDHISHSHITDTLKAWCVPETTVNIIRRMLKAKTLVGNELESVESGTPQGGILSPMLANTALTGLDNHCAKEYGRKRKGEIINPIVRYADDFVIVCGSQQEAEDIRDTIAEYLSRTMGLELSREKTRITHVEAGFDFLGFNVKKYRKRSPRSKYHKVGQLLMKPQKEKVKGFLQEVKDVLDSHKASKPETIIRLLNPKIQGFGMYYRHAVSSQVFGYISREIWQKSWRWSKRRHPGKSVSWIKRKYYDDRWNLVSETGERLLDIARIRIVRHRKVKLGMRVYARDEQTREYWKQWEYRKGLEQIYSRRLDRLYRRQKGRCQICGQLITRRDISKSQVHTHHIIPRKEGGTEGLNNLCLLHVECHKEMHRNSLMTHSNVI